MRLRDPERTVFMNSSNGEHILLRFVHGLISAVAALAFATGCNPTVNEKSSPTATANSSLTSAAYSDCTDNVFNAGQCSTAAGRYVTATLGAAVSGANGELAKTIPQGFYSGAQSCTMSDTNLISGNIKKGTNIFGVTGSADFPEFTHSQTFRIDNSSTTLANLRNPAWVNARTRATLSDELNLASNYVTLGTGKHRLVPDPKYDTDGWGDDTGIGTAKLNFLETIQGRPTVVCGTSGTIPAKITDCLNKNGAKAIWEGAKYGKQGEGDWKLVTLLNHNAANWEVWRDERTKLIWSDATHHLTVGWTSIYYNWFQAAGYSSNTSTIATTLYEGRANAGTDCDAGTAPCQPAVPISVCAHASLLSNLNGIASYSTPDISYLKGNLDVPSVVWRLPTLDDWKQADVNGIRKVLPNMDQFFWTATSISYEHASAWMYDGSDGMLVKMYRYYENAVRCVAGGL